VVPGGPQMQHVWRSDDEAGAQLTLYSRERALKTLKMACRYT
jgi:hypothetical protein